MTGQPAGRACWAALALAALLPAGAVAQGPVTLEFSFSNPGARAMGFGGAFAAIADDATAAFANPAGLVQLLRPEVSTEVRRWSYSTPYYRSGRLSGEPSGVGIDNVAGLREAESQAVLTGLSFASLVYPIGRSSFAVYRHELARFRSFAETQGLFGGGTDYATALRYVDSRTHFELDVTGFGLAWGFSVSESLSIGAAAVRYSGTIRSTVGAFLVDEPTEESFFGTNHFLPQNLVYRTDVGGGGIDWGLSAGFLWSFSPRVTFGGFFRQAPAFAMDGFSAAGPGHSSQPDGEIMETVRATVSLPDVYGVGLSYRSADGRLTLAAEWDRVQYSDIIESILRSSEWEPGQTIDDGNELHLGSEYAILQWRPIVALRLGVWLDPDHRLRSTGNDPYEHALFTGGDDEMHYAVGAGVAFESLQIDLGLDFSDVLNTASVSFIYSF